MNIPCQRKSTLRSIVSLYFLVVATLLLAMSQLTGTAADTNMQQTGALWFSMIESDAPLASASILVGPEVRLNSPEGVFTGPQGVNEFISTLRRSFSNLDFATKSTETVDNLVIVTFSMSGINTGSYHELPAKCGGVAVDGVAVLQLDGSGIHEQWIGYDQSTLRAQIDAFNQIDPIGRPSCNFVPDPVPAPIPMPEPSTCVRKDRCDAWS
jgi:hypothetical protein